MGVLGGGRGFVRKLMAVGFIKLILFPGLGTCTFGTFGFPTILKEFSLASGRVKTLLLLP